MSDSPSSYTLLIVDRAAREGAGNGQVQSMGTNRGQGYTAEQLRQIHDKVSQSGEVTSRLYELNPLCTEVATEDACVLVIKLPQETADGALHEMQNNVRYSLFKKSYGRSVRARSRNISYVSNFTTPEDPDTNAPSVTDWSDLPHCQKAKQILNDALSDTEAAHAVAIRYEDYKRCGVRWHGDAERSKTLVVRLGPNSKHHPSTSCGTTTTNQSPTRSRSTWITVRCASRPPRRSVPTSRSRRFLPSVTRPGLYRPTRAHPRYPKRHKSACAGSDSRSHQTRLASITEEGCSCNCVDCVALMSEGVPKRVPDTLCILSVLQIPKLRSWHRLLGNGTS